MKAHLCGPLGLEGCGQGAQHGLTQMLGSQPSSPLLPKMTQDTLTLPSLLCDERDMQDPDDFREKEMEKSLDK